MTLVQTYISKLYFFICSGLLCAEIPCQYFNLKIYNVEIFIIFSTKIISSWLWCPYSNIWLPFGCCHLPGWSHKSLFWLITNLTFDSPLHCWLTNLLFKTVLGSQLTCFFSCSIPAQLWLALVLTNFYFISYYLVPNPITFHLCFTNMGTFHFAF